MGPINNMCHLALLSYPGTPTGHTRGNGLKTNCSDPGSLIREVLAQKGLKCQLFYFLQITRYI